MAAVTAPKFEDVRLSALRRTLILDTRPEVKFNEIALYAAALCMTPVALISLVDEKRQWFKAKFGVDLTETDRGHSLCSQAMMNEGVFQVHDLSKDLRFSGNPLVSGPPHLRAYTGVPLLSTDGFPLGTLCVLDVKPRSFEPYQLTVLSELALDVMNLLEEKRGREAVGEPEWISPASLIRVAMMRMQHPVPNLRLQRLSTRPLRCRPIAFTEELNDVIREHHRASGSVRPIELSCTDLDGMVQLNVSSVLHPRSTLYIASP